MNTKSFILDYDFNGDINDLVLAIQKGEAIQYNGMPFAIKNAYSQGKQIVLPLSHKNIFVDLRDVLKIVKNNQIVKITINIQK